MCNIASIFKKSLLHYMGHTNSYIALKNDFSFNELSTRDQSKIQLNFVFGTQFKICRQFILNKNAVDNSSRPKFDWNYLYPTLKTAGLTVENF